MSWPCSSPRGGRDLQNLLRVRRGHPSVRSRLHRLGRFGQFLGVRRARPPRKTVLSGGLVALLLLLQRSPLLPGLLALLKLALLRLVMLRRLLLLFYILGP